MTLSCVPDHVAVAVPAIDDAATRWHDRLQGAWAGPRLPLPDAGFATRQLRFAGGAKLELLEPTGDGFAATFLARYGARIHHVTLQVPALLPAVDTVRHAGLDVVDVFAEGDAWHEAFLRPSQVGGLIVQLAWVGRTEEEWARLTGFTPEPVADDGPRLLGPRLQHPDLDAAADVWTLLGGEVDRHEHRLHVTWPGAPLDVEVVRGEVAGPVGLRFAGVDRSDADAVTGPAVLPVGAGDRPAD